MMRKGVDGKLFFASQKTAVPKNFQKVALAVLNGEGNFLECLLIV